MVADNDTLNITNLARAMGVSRSTIYQYIANGYEPEYGKLTTLGHLRQWLRDVYRPRLAAEREAKRLAMQRQLQRLR
jgi:predicted DNA-binding transcriptional regulator AlpA